MIDPNCYYYYYYYYHYYYYYYCYYYHYYYCFLSELSFTDINDSQDSRGREGTIFYSIHHFHPLTNIQRYICNFACEMTCVYQTATQWDLLPYRITLWLFNDVMLISVYLLDNLILGFCYSNLRQETGGHGLASTITLVLQANPLTKFARHP